MIDIFFITPLIILYYGAILLFIIYDMIIYYLI